jgi:large subunit ribosomal protein L25
MEKNVTFAAEVRDTRGKNAARRARRSGRIPAVVYGAYKDAISLAVDPKEVSRILRSASGHNTIFNLDIKGVENTPVMVVDWQNDPVTSSLLHIDLKRIDLTKRIKVSVPVVTTGEAKGVKTQGGLLELVTREVEIECLPDEIPEHFVVDVTELLIGQSKRASDLPLFGSVTLVSNADSVVAHVVALRAVEEAAPAAAPVEAAPTAAEPEVIKKGKKEEEGEAEESKGKKK